MNVYLVIIVCMLVLLIIVIYVFYRRISMKDEKLRNMDEFFQLTCSLFDELSIGFALKDADNDFRYVMANRFFCRIEGLDREKILGRNLEEIGQKDYQWTTSRDKEVCDKGIPLVSEYYRIEDGFMRSYRNVRKRFILKDEHRYVLSIIDDVTNEKTIERDFDEYRKKFEVSLEASQMSLWEYDVALQRIFFNGSDKTIFGESLSLDRFINMIYSDDQQIVSNSFYKLISGKEDSSNIQFRLKREDNDYRWLRIYMKVLKRDLQTDMVLRLVGLYKDVTEEQMILQELERLRLNNKY